MNAGSSVFKTKTAAIATVLLACLEGFEPPTYWFVASHSIQLSYKHTSFNDLIIIAYPTMKVKQFFDIRMYALIYVKMLACIYKNTNFQKMG